jgi:hypothetical protein
MDSGRNTIICWTLISVLPCVGEVVAAHRPAAVGATELRRQLGEIHGRIRTWYVEYETTPSSDPKKPLGAHVHRIVAASRPDRFYRLSAKGTAARSWHDDPFQTRLILTSSSAVAESPMERTFAILPVEAGDPLPGDLSNELLLTALGWWPFEDRPVPTLAGRVFLDIARSPDYVVRPTQDLIEGRWCHVLEYPGRDRLWLDVERDCALLVRETYHPRSHALAQRIEMKGHREIKPGIWVPMEFHNTRFRDSDQSEDQRKVVDAVVQVLNVRVNDPLPDAIFEFKPRPGSIQIFENRRFEQKVAGGTDRLDEIVGWIRRYVGSGRTSTRGLVASVEAVIEYGVSILCIGGIVALRWRRRTRSGRLAAVTEQKPTHL